MKLNHEMVRRILIEVDRPEKNVNAIFHRLNRDDYGCGFLKWDEVCHCVKLMQEGGLICSYGDGDVRLTFSGHEALSLIRNDFYWNEARALIQKQVESTSWGITLDLVKKLTLEAIASPTV